MNYLALALFCATGVLLFLSVLATILRCFVRICILNSFALDDYLMTAAAILYIAGNSFVFDAIRLTHDKELVDVIAVLSRAMRDIYFGEVFYVLTVWSLKLSIGTFLLRVVQRPIQKYIIQGVLALVSIYSTVFLGLVIFQCNPVQHFWQPLNPTGSCRPGRINTQTSYVHAAMIGGSDLLFAILPMFVVWNIKMNSAMKFSVAGLLGLGAIAGITTFIRMPYIAALEEASVLNFFDVISHLAIWTCIEPGVGIFVGSLAALRPLFRNGPGTSSASIFNRSTPKVDSNKRYWPAERSYPMDSFETANKKVSTTVVGGIYGGHSKDGMLC